MVTETADGYVLANDHARFEIACNEGFELRQVTDVATGTDLLAESPYFDGVPLSLRVQDGTYAPRRFPGSALTTRSRSTEERDGHQRLDAELVATTAKAGDVVVAVTVDLPPDTGLASWTVTVEADDAAGLLTFPDLHVAVDGSPPKWGLIPTELGVSGALGRTENRIGIATEHFMNNMQFGVVGAGPDGPGVGVVNRLADPTDLHLRVDRDGRFQGKPQQFQAAGGEPQVISDLLLGPVGGWRAIADVYREGTRAEPPATAPDWLREAGGLYGFDGGGGGSIYLGFERRVEADWTDYSHGSLAGQLDSFEDLPDLLDEAESCGTNVVFLWDYWDDAGDEQLHYANKGDYVPREDLGGASAFEAGVDAIHDRGGKVMVYVEPFIAHLRSAVGLAHGDDWSLKGPTGEPRTFYHKQWTMCPSVRGWQDHVVDVSRRLVGEHGVDGIYLDSYGLQWAYECYDASHDHPPTRRAFNEGVIELTRRVRDAIRELRSDAVVVTESHNDRLGPTIDAGLDGCFFWSQYAGAPQPPLERSPLRYVFPHFQVFSGGTELPHVHQAFAAGAGLALAPHWLDASGHLQGLLDARRELADAMVYGSLGEAPAVESAGAVAYRHVGDEHEVVTVAATGDDGWDGALTTGGTRWTDALTDASYEADDGTVELELGEGEGGVAVLVADD